MFEMFIQGNKVQIFWPLAREVLFQLVQQAKELHLDKTKE